MSTVRPMTAMDLFKFNPCNLDHLTETYNVTFYLEYLSKWPHLCRVIEGHNGQIEGYSMIQIERYCLNVCLTLLQSWESWSLHHTRHPSHLIRPAPMSIKTISHGTVMLPL
jgi:ribosomal protein S18 acetylase RimI-like enzyme